MFFFNACVLFKPTVQTTYRVFPADHLAQLCSQAHVIAHLKHTIINKSLLICTQQPDMLSHSTRGDNGELTIHTHTNP